MIEVNQLNKKFGEHLVVDNISFSVGKGEVLGFLGPNGAGKSTSMKMITGFLTPTSGKVSICGHDIASEPIEAKTKIGYLPEGAPGYGDMTPKSFLRFIGEIRGYSDDDLHKRVESAIEKVNLQSVVHQSIDTLSKGFKRRVGMAQAILHDPPVLIMDEPTDGLDPNQKHEVRLLIKEMAKEKAIIVSTHILEEVEAVCSRAIIIAQGKLLFDGSPEDLAAQSKYHNAVKLTVSTDRADEVIAKLKAIKTVAQVEIMSQDQQSLCCTVVAHAGKSIIRDISDLVRSENWSLNEMSMVTGKLDDVFRQITTQSKELQGVLS